MIIVDTHVLSELMRARPEQAVVAWVSARPSTALFTTTVTQAEILFGIELLPAGKRQAQLKGAVEQMFAEDFAGRVLPFDCAAAREFALIAAVRRRSGRPIAQFDAQIAAIARSRAAALATRNGVDFEGCGVELFDPWTT